MCGVSSAFLARSGYRSGPLEGEPPRYHAALHILSDGPDLQKPLLDLESKWHSRDVAFKPYPLGHLIVGPVKAVLDLMAEQPIDAEAVERVDVATYRAAVHGCGKKYSTPESNYVDCHFSIPFCVAATLIEKEMTPRQLRNGFITDARVHGLAARVVVEEDTEMTARFPADGCDLDLMFGFSGVLASRTDRASPKIVATDLGSASTNVDSIQSPHPCLSSASPIGTSAV